MNQRELQYFATQEIKFIRVLGRGAFGVVYHVHSDHYGSEFALKKIPENAFNTMELECLIEIDTPRKTHLYQYFRFENSIYLLMEFCPYDLSKIIKTKNTLPSDVFMNYVRDVVLAVKACHDQNIAHSDIKPSNFLIDQYGRVKISDFGLSSIYKGDPISFAFSGTKLYMAPEIFNKSAYNPIIADMWALGVTIFYMVTKDYPFKSDNEELLTYIIHRGKYKDDMIKDDLLKAVIARCLTVDVKQRASCDELLEMPYFHQDFFMQQLRPSNSRISLKSMAHDPIFKPKIPEVRSIVSMQSTFYRNNSSSRLRLTIPESKSQAQPFIPTNVIEE